MYDIDLQSRIPIYEQIYKKVLQLAVKKILKPNEQLPSVRVLAKELGVNPNTISKAYLQLENNGIIYSLSGRGSFISDFDFDLIKDKAVMDFKASVLEALDIGIQKQELIDIINKEVSIG